MLLDPSLLDQKRHSEQTLHADATTAVEERGTGKERNDTSYSTFLWRSPSILFWTLFYIILAVYAWVVTCVLTHRPIGPKHYGVDILNADDNGWGWIGAKAYHALYIDSARHFKAARTLQSVVSVLAIPMTSAVCSRAAVAFLQSGRRTRARRISMRQAMALVDESWMDLSVIASLIFLGSWKRYGSSLLVFAIFLITLGAVMSPLQEFFLTTKIIQTPTFPQLITNLVDIPDHFDPLKGSFDYGYITALTRARLASTTNDQPQMNLWSQALDCNTLTQTKNSLLCVLGGGQYILGNMSLLNDPFFSQLPSGFSTGLVKQFAPRINSTAHRENITAAAFPANCDQIPDALFLRYANISNAGSYALEVCMPGNVTASPWKSQRSRQDFSEELYLNITLSGFDGIQAFSGADTSFYSKITLPNYMNGGINGPLLTDDPSHYCDLACETQGPGLAGHDPIYDHNITSRATSTGSPTDVAQQLFNNQNKGPLLFVALALFGMGSFIDKAAELRDILFCGEERERHGTVSGCGCLLPLVVHIQFMGRLRRRANQNAFTSAAFLANQAWMTSITDGDLWVSYDLGADILVPVISRTAMIALSTLLGVYLLSLLSLAIYSVWSPHWTTRLDSFAMMRIGASLSDKLPLVLANGASSFKVLDETPGWIGDASGGIGAVGELGVGADAPRKDLEASFNTAIRPNEEHAGSIYATNCWRGLQRIDIIRHHAINCNHRLPLHYDHPKSSDGGFEKELSKVFKFLASRSSFG
ncbi:hypothetical protein C8F01DRAFT_1272425 [Mycena amicta]|nr:hypothetical protein C8F01DRAFT_1272425 [Mycena amicta]